MIFKLWGWEWKSNLPPELQSFVLICVPHTSNFDFVPGMTVSLKLNRNAKFLIKDSWLKFPMNLILKPLGAIGVNREKLKEMKGGHSTDAMAHLFEEHSPMVLMISPEGTRKANSNWKTGFFYIAQKANVPIVLGYADWATKTAGMGPIIYPTNYEADMKIITDFYRGISGKIKENFKVDSRF